ncbi:MAG TPA: trypsin-like serine protease [Pseudobdellovibrionaceae bacterium]
MTHQKVAKLINVATLLILILSYAELGMAITKGKSLDQATPAQRKAFESVVFLSVTGGSQSTGSGTAIHIGNGVLLTAAHVIYGFNDEAMAIVALNSEKNSLGGGLIEPEWERISAPKLGTLTDKYGEYSIPDLALLIPKDPDLRAKIAGLPVIKISTEAPAIGETFTYLGNGPGASNGLEQFGQLKISEVGEIYSTSLSNKKNGVSALEPGDSGGSLFRENAAGVLELVGIGFEAMNQGKESLSLINKLQDSRIKEWLSSAYEKINSTPLLWAQGLNRSCKSVFIF